ncbi:leucine-rich repeat-containing protein 3B [Erpetoichthys calabaricus]|uniref:leucine-rich repeat-containing protein 3B n=1 Tax=Erpetoichthys calabaricus TaxID=27687 RepID=UPI00109F5988|nr:leucine-rich repeat-containing protein 3B [Erpetoichthys calabaricus]
MPLLLDWLLRHSVAMCLLLHSFVLMTFCFHHAATSCSKGCYCSETGEGVKTVRCSNTRLGEIPQDIPNDTHRLYLDFNNIAAVPADAFRDLTLLVELDLSHNIIAKLESGAFRGLNERLQLLDLSSNRLMSLNKDAFGNLKARTNLSNNPWHCDCALQNLLPTMELDPVSLAGIVCETAVPEEYAGKPFLLAKDVDFCNVSKKTTDVAMLVTMFGWFTMVISYLVYYVRQNQEDARRHLEYLKSLPSKQRKSEESSTISTVV